MVACTTQMCHLINDEKVFALIEMYYSLYVFQLMPSKSLPLIELSTLSKQKKKKKNYLASNY